MINGSLGGKQFKEQPVVKEITTQDKINSIAMNNSKRIEKEKEEDSYIF